MRASNKSGAPARKKRLLIVDDHPLVRQGIRMVAAQEPDLEVCAEAAGVHEALEAVESAHPDVAVVDLTLGEGSGLDLIKDLHVRRPKLPVLVLSMRDEGFYAERVLRAGARGYVTKEEGAEKILEGIRKVLQGQIYVSEKMASKIMGGLVPGGPAGKSPVEKLTDRELNIFELIGKGMPTREVAARLHVSVKTVESHRENIKLKLKLENAAELLRHAVEWVRMQDRK